MKDESVIAPVEVYLHPSAFILRPLILARVAQLMERWSYKPEVEGLSPSLGTKSNSQVIGA